MSQPTPYRVLDVGAGHGSDAVEAFGFPVEVTTLDRPGSGADIEVDLESEEFQALEGEWDILLLSHVLEHVSLRSVQPVLHKCYDLLVAAPEDDPASQSGILHILVPSLEWACEQILSENPSIITRLHIFGAQTDAGQYHKCGFTLLDLRAALTEAGFRIAKLKRGQYGVQVTPKEGAEPVVYLAEQLYAVGVKAYGSEIAQAAIKKEVDAEGVQEHEGAGN